ncbi:U1 small nuclear ribonucleoprotein 70 kDa-like [Bactrocera neohumeralis]|uniref:U1 small nuclear ribonucleoprotein 70 kDa-like n=1 Tax=Bactrocera neohumeralis TaxID=98809 RepID=UPI002166A139|nr:U1 small nuclear ribonucleoprotein 70 kDa-like [Bactrocera neohumeralis]
MTTNNEYNYDFSDTTQTDENEQSLDLTDEKCSDAEGDTTGRNSAQKSTKLVAALKDTRTSKGGSSSIKDERKCSKSDDDKSKRKDEKSGDKKDKDISEQKSSSNQISQKDDKEKSSVNISTKSSSTGKQTTPSPQQVSPKHVWIQQKNEDKKIQDTTSTTRDDKRKTIDTKKDHASKKPEVEKDEQRDKEKEKDHMKDVKVKKDVHKTIEIAEIDLVGKADVVTTIWELLIPWQLALTNETSITICVSERNHNVPNVVSSIMNPLIAPSKTVKGVSFANVLKSGLGKLTTTVTTSLIEPQERQPYVQSGSQSNIEAMIASMQHSMMNFITFMQNTMQDRMRNQNTLQQLLANQSSK